ncbi:hydantoinase/carbamoylase family amidase [Frigidibacter sp. MR17.24]|uniref:hydantoinase/carbamoylase family amidase n=1 Tax=Frigidibacter sp. MR17.24 TaxID=3127345 RepID=UPI003012D5EB
MSGPAIDAARLQADLDALAAITDPDRPWTRRSFSQRFLAGRDWLRAAFEAEGLAVRLDAAGNLIGARPGSDPAAPILMTGSHSDTVPDGGRFDGIAGILCGLAAIRALNAAGIATRHPLELVDFLAEEPSDWGISCVGSRGMAGALSPADLARSGPGGETLGAAIDRIGGCVARLDTARRGSEVAGFLELHIEQGRVLEQAGAGLGIVSAIVAIRRYGVRFAGTAGHAGTTPMAGRADAGLALARLSLGVRDLGVEFAGLGRGHFVATIGVSTLLPGGANVVPGAAEAVLDIRAEDPALLDLFETRLATLVAACAAAEGCEAAPVDEISRSAGHVGDAALRDCLSRAAESRQERWLPIASGAGHDTMFVGRFAPAAMLFVPSVEGRSHCPEEETALPDLVRGATCLMEALLLRDARA